MVLEIIISKFSCILKMMTSNTFSEPQPDSASYIYFLILFFSFFVYCLQTQHINHCFPELFTLHHLLCTVYSSTLTLQWLFRTVYPAPFTLQHLLSIDTSPIFNVHHSPCTISSAWLHCTFFLCLVYFAPFTHFLVTGLFIVYCVLLTVYCLLVMVYGIPIFTESAHWADLV